MASPLFRRFRCYAPRMRQSKLNSVLNRTQRNPHLCPPPPPVARRQLFMSLLLKFGHHFSAPPASFSHELSSHLDITREKETRGGGEVSEVA